MKSKLWRILAGISLSVISTACIGADAEMNILASFEPSMANPQNNTFTNDTPPGGYCLSYPAQCSAHKTFSIDMGGITASLVSDGFKANSEPRMGMYFKMPGAWREVTVTNSESSLRTSTVKFRINGFSATYRTLVNWSLEEHWAKWVGSSFVNQPKPCGYSGVGALPNRAYSFIWKWPASDVSCVKIAKVDLTGEPYQIDTTSIGYEIQTPDPLKMESGIYKGTLKYSVGPNGDIDFGDNLAPSHTGLTINFTLSVNHELMLTTAPEDRNVTLQPCAAGRICSEDEGKANWERWMVSQITPQLTGRSNFKLSSSGTFTVYTECSEQVGDQCALKGDNTSQQIPVQTLLTLPSNIEDISSGATVVKRPLTVGKDLTKNVFATREFGQDRSGSIDFLIAQRDVDTMLKNRPDTFRGAVTVFFDPKIY
ncbi:hypothetical protein [Enterobacter sp. Bisph1]|uniref:hypothetical protein n=1 Tax=Enterobacter sp. Bisph1 TaxID=1274399 RepID=UPI00068C28E7|nr:hypothetical protein [Enterobacter sp. Bisph1]